MYRLFFAACVFAVQACFVPSLYAERPPEKREDASYVITGTVEGVYLRQTKRYRHYVIKILVEEVERGKGPRPGEFFYAACFQRRKDAPPQPSPQGHTRIPRTGQRITAYVNHRHGENEGVYPNWVDVLGAGGS